MEMNKVVLAGGSGYLGSVIADFYRNKAKEIVILSRVARAQKGNIRTVKWSTEKIGPWTIELEGCDLLINLNGKNVNCRYTEKNKIEIIKSRVDATKVLGEAVKQLSNPPKVWIQLASATIYRHAEDRFMDEQTRKIVLRVGIVLGSRDGVFPRLKNLTRLGLGGKQGSGKQYVSWIHEDDVANIIDWSYQHIEILGTYNCTSPGPIMNKDFMRIIKQACRVTFALPAPVWLLKIGAMVIGTETELILKSRWVMPTKLMQAGYQFQFADARKAIENILSTDDTHPH
jgi:NAD dependent epimerase/dehydratase family enzyme